MEQSGDTSNHEISKQIAGYQSLCLDSKPHAWGAVDRHNIPKGQRAFHKGSNTLQKGSKA